jgi:hypothetical protein
MHEKRPINKDSFKKGLSNKYLVVEESKKCRSESYSFGA